MKCPITLSGLVAAASMAAMASITLAAAARTPPTPRPTPLMAQVVKVDGANLTVETRPITGPDGIIAAEQKTYATDASTVVQVDGQKSKLADLKSGEMVRLNLSTNGKTAEEIMARTMNARGPRNGG